MGNEVKTENQADIQVPEANINSNPPVEETDIIQQPEIIAEEQINDNQNEVFNRLIEVKTVKTEKKSPLEKIDGKHKDFNHFERISCTTVYESHRSIFEAYSSNKYNSTGVIQWIINNAFPSNIWHLYNYYFTSFPAYFSMKKTGE